LAANTCRERGLRLLVASVAGFFVSMTSLGSLVSRYARDLGYSAAQSIQVYAVAPLVAASLRIPVGLAADRLGLRVFLVAGGLAAATAAGVALAARSLLGVAAVRGLQGVALAVFVAPSIAAAAALGGEEVARAIAARAVAVTAAAALGPLVAGVAADHMGYHAAFLISLAAGAAAAVGAARLPLGRGCCGVGAKGEAVFSSLARVLGSPGVLLAAALAFVDGLLFFGLQSLPQVQLRDLGYGATVFGVFQFFAAGAGLVARWLSGSLYPRYGLRRVLPLGFAASAAGLIVIALEPRPPLVYLAALLYGVGSGVSIPGEQILVSRWAPGANRGLAASVYTLGFDTGGSLGLFSASLLVAALGYRGGYICLAAAAAGAATVSATLLPRATRRRGQG